MIVKLILYISNQFQIGISDNWKSLSLKYQHFRRLANRNIHFQLGYTSVTGFQYVSVSYHYTSHLLFLKFKLKLTLHMFWRQFQLDKNMIYSFGGIFHKTTKYRYNNILCFWFFRSYFYVQFKIIQIKIYAFIIGQFI